MAHPLTIALVGADGSGKTTVLHKLLAALPKARCVYLGASIDAANYALPTSRWLMRRKRRALAGVLDESDAVPPAAIMPDELKQRLPQGSLFKTIGLINRIAEEWYRELIVTQFKWRGYTVLCDRHFLFEYCPHDTRHSRERLLLSERIHLWLLAKCYPRPDLTIFLDAPPEVLQRRKPEWTLEHVARQRGAILEEGRHVRDFVRVDATESPDAVLAEVMRLIARHTGNRAIRAADHADSARL